MAPIVEDKAEQTSASIESEKAKMRASMENDVELRILAPYRYMAEQLDYLDMSLLILDLFNYWIKLPQEKYDMFKDFFEKFYHATILLDDIQDRTAIRRTKPVACRVFGTKKAANTANYMFFVEMRKMLDWLPEEQAAKGLKIYSEWTRELWKGQGLDIYYRDSSIPPDEVEWRSLVDKKAAAFVIMFVELMQLFSEDKRNYRHLITEFLLFLQYRDDYVNLTSALFAEKKGFAGDITEGKFSFPLMHFVNNNPDKDTIINILKKRTEDESLKKWVIEKLGSSGTFNEATKRIQDITKGILEEIEQFGGNPMFTEWMKKCDDFDKQTVW